MYKPQLEMSCTHYFVHQCQKKKNLQELSMPFATVLYILEPKLLKM